MHKSSLPLPNKWLDLRGKWIQFGDQYWKYPLNCGMFHIRNITEANIPTASKELDVNPKAILKNCFRSTSHVLGEVHVVPWSHPLLTVSSLEMKPLANSHPSSCHCCHCSMDGNPSWILCEAGLIESLDIIFVRFWSIVNSCQFR